MLTVFGSINMDLIMQVPELPKPGETVLTDRYVTKPGGKGANQAVAAARSGGQVAMVGAVGPDGYGESLLRTLKDDGVDISAISTSEDPTGIAYICVDHAAENFIAVASGANRSPTADQLGNDALAKGNTLLMQMEIPPEQNWRAIERAASLGARTILNVAPAGIVPPESLALLDILIVNEHEARTVARSAELSNAPPEQPIAALAGTLSTSFGLTCIVTVGSQGAIVSQGTQTYRVPALPIEPVDTTGAGDAFCGILAAGLDAGLDLPLALDRAVAGSALACLALGAQESLPTVQAIDQVVNKVLPPVAL
ncbi:MAG: ribokinase [Pseudomonadota bacterium]